MITAVVKVEVWIIHWKLWARNLVAAGPLLKHAQHNLHSSLLPG